MTDTPDPDSPRGRGGAGSVREVAGVFLRLGTIAFGGPVAHTALMRHELVQRRGWVSDARFVDLIGATNLIPGPNSTELAIHLGYDRARWRGLLVAGACFILPAAVLVTVLAWAYLRYGDTPAASALLYGIVPAVIAIIVHALIKLTPVAVRNVGLGVLAAAGFAAYLLGVNELLVLAAGAALAAAARLVRHRPQAMMSAPWWVGAPWAGAPWAHAPWANAPLFGDPTAGQLWQLFATMLKIGAVLYGSGYVLLAFLRGDFVDRLGWLTEEQLTDAIAIGQVTPGPVFTTATFVGYLVAGPIGALLATIAIFLPSFAFVGLLTRITDRLRSSPWTSALLDGVNATALALMAGVTLQLGRSAIVDPLTALIALATLTLLWRTRLNSAWYIGAGALIGLARMGLTELVGG